MLDVFNQDAFSFISLTAHINDQPYVPGQIGASGLFEVDGIDTTTVAIEKRDNTLGLVGLTPRGGPGETIIVPDDNIRYFRVPHFQRDDAVMADEVQGRRAFGTVTVDTVMNRVDRKVARHLRDFDTTLEHQRVGAIKGILTDKFGNSYLNLYATFGITAPTPIVFPFATAAGRTTGVNANDIAVAARTLLYQMEDVIDVPYTGVDAWCGKTWFSTLIDLPEVRAVYLNQVAATSLLLGRGIEAVDSFAYGGITWHRYRTGRRAVAANANAPFIADAEARFVLRGVPGLFETRYAPADYNETVNTMGLPRYMKMWPREDDKGMELQIQTNPVSYCTRPESLFSATMG